MGLKKNVDQFNQDILRQGGYRYTINAPYSSKVANQRMTQAILERIPLDAGTLIDIGCGDGVYTQILKDSRPSLKITGVDAAPKAIELAREKYPQIEFLLWDVTSPFRSRLFDVAVVRGLLHHTSFPDKVLENIANTARHIIIVEPNGNNPVLKIIEKVSPYHRAHEERSFSSGLLRRWCYLAGLNVVSLDFIGFVPMFFPAFFAQLILCLQPFLERIPVVKHFLSAQIVIVCQPSNNALS